MKKYIKTLCVLLSILLCLGALASCGDDLVPEETLPPNVSENYKTRVDFGAKFEPKGNYILHGAGQSYTQFAGYMSVMGSELTPAICMSYVSVHQYYQAAGSNLFKMIEPYADAGWLFFQIGTHFNEDENPDKVYYQEIAEGKLDDKLKEMITIFKNLKRPVFCRAGFEFNSECNGYKDPEIYKRAFIRFAELVEECEADNIALVWCYNPDGAEREYMKYYPGDEYVDWWAIDIFRIGTIDLDCTKNFLREAEFHEKPVMIGESTCYTYYVQNENAWDGWYEKYFQFVRDNPVIKATCYINVNWETYDPKWQGWGDSRLEAAEYGLAEKYVAELSDSIYLHAMDKQTAIKMLYDCADYEK